MNKKHIEYDVTTLIGLKNKFEILVDSLVIVF
jgi:hypothetical protein